MKNVYQLLMPIVACIALALTGCAEQDLTDANKEGQPKANYYSQLGVTLKENTRTSYAEEATQVKVTWNKGDQIKLVKVNASDTGLDNIIFEIKEDKYDGKKNAIFHIKTDEEAYTGTPSPNTYNPEIAYKAIYPATLTADPTSNALNAFFEAQEQDGANMNHVGKYNVMVGYKKPKIDDKIDVTIYDDNTYANEGMGHVSSVIKTIVRAPSKYEGTDAYQSCKPQIVKLIIKDLSDKIYNVDLNLKNLSIASDGTFPAYLTIPYNTGFKEIEVKASFAKKQGTNGILMGSVAKKFASSQGKTTEFGKMYDLKVDFKDATVDEAEGVNMGGTVWARYNLGVKPSADATEADKKKAEADYGNYYQWGMLNGWKWGQTGISATTSKLNDAPQEILKQIFGKTIHSKFGGGGVNYKEPNTECDLGERVDIQGMVVTTPAISWSYDKYDIVKNAFTTSASVNGVSVFTPGKKDEIVKEGFYYTSTTTSTDYQPAYGKQYKPGSATTLRVEWFKDEACTQNILNGWVIHKKSSATTTVEAGTYGDAATNELGAAWQMPTILQIQALLEECSKTKGSITHATQINTEGTTVHGIKFKSPDGGTFFYPAGGAWDGSKGAEWGGAIADYNNHLRYYCSTSSYDSDQYGNAPTNQSKPAACEFHVLEANGDSFTLNIHTQHFREAACPIRPVARLTNSFFD